MQAQDPIPRAAHPPEGAPSPELLQLLHTAVQQGASDMHIVPGYRPMLRVSGQMRPVGETILTPGDAKELVAALLPHRLRERLDDSKNLDCSLAVPHEGVTQRFRASVYLSQGDWCACLRHIPNEIPTLDWLGFPDDLAKRITAHRNGLVVITGVTGSGKSSTLAALVKLIRRDAGKRVLTIEEPIEYVHAPAPDAALVTQREVGRDVDSFADGLKHGLRQDPNVILVGEIRDHETAQIAISAAETGHLILTTLHTRDAKGALTRLVDIFPQASQDDIRSQLAMSLRSIVCQHLLPAAESDEKRALALEVLHVNQQAQIAIRAGKIETIESVLQTGKRDGMWTFDDDLQRLVRAGAVSVDVARRYANDPAGITGPAQAW